MFTVKDGERNQKGLQAPPISWGGGGENGAFPVSLSMKLLQARKNTSGYVKKDARNEAQRYNYVSEKRFIGEVREVLTDLGIMTLTSTYANDVEVVAKGDKISYLNTVIMSYTFVEAETGAWCTVYVVGQGQDNGDKASNKALTGANKYGLRHALMIATGDEPEEPREDEWDQRSNGNGAKGKGKAQAEPPKWGKAEYIAELKRVQAELERLGVTGVKALPDDKTLEGYNIETLEQALAGRESKLPADQTANN